MTFILIFISAIFVNNIVLSQFLGVCPFLGASNKVGNVLGMTGAIAFVMTISTIATYIIQKTLLEPFNLQFLQTITFILIITFLIQITGMILKKVSKPLYQILGVYLPMMTTNCVILGVALLVVQKEYNLLESVVFAISTAIGYGLVLILFAGIREQLNLVNLPKSMEGLPAALITAGILAMAFMGFVGIVR